MIESNTDFKGFVWSQTVSLLFSKAVEKAPVIWDQSAFEIIGVLTVSAEALSYYGSDGFRLFGNNLFLFKLALVKKELFTKTPAPLVRI